MGLDGEPASFSASARFALARGFSGTSSTSVAEVIFGCGTCTWTWYELPLASSRQKIRVVYRLEYVAAISASPTSRAVTRLSPARWRSRVTWTVG